MAYPQQDRAVEYLDDWWVHRRSAGQKGLQLAPPTQALPPDSLEARVGAFEKGVIVEALQHSHGNQTKAAKLLGTTKRIIQYKIKKYDIDYRAFRFTGLPAHS